MRQDFKNYQYKAVRKPWNENMPKELLMYSVERNAFHLQPAEKNR
jgi:hypothetical protein